MTSQNSTNVRSLAARLVSSAFGAIERVSSDGAARLARWLFFRAPKRMKVRKQERAVLATGKHFKLLVQGEKIACWKWGQGPLVLLVHGWGGTGAQLTPLVEPLVRRGFTVVSFDGPGHGASGGSSLSIPKIAAVISRLAQTFGPIHGLVAHSFGALGVSFALQRLVDARAAVFIAPPSDPMNWFAAFSSFVGLSNTLRAKTEAEIERWVGLRFSEIRASAMLAEVDTRILVIHDRIDTQVPLEEGEVVAQSAQRGRLTITEGLGHRRILRDRLVIEETAAYLSETPADRCITCGAPCNSLDEVCPSCLLSEELFDRTRRWAA